MQWITREQPKIDRIACPWLIQRFIDAVTALQEAIDHCELGHVGAATKHAQAAARHIQAGNK